MALLNGRKALVTGSSRGIGADIARGLAAHGAAVAVAARSDEASPDPRLPGTIRTVAEEIRAAGGTAVPIPLDVRDPDSISSAVERTASELGGFDLLINNAAVLVPGTLESVKDRHIDLIWQLDLRGPILLAKAAVPYMKEAGGGDIINISSGAADFPGPGPYDDPRSGGQFYGMVKAGLERFTQGMAMELQQYKIACNILTLRYLIKTPGHWYALTSPDNPQTEFEEATWMAKASAWIASQPPAYTGNIVDDQTMRDTLADL